MDLEIDIKMLDVGKTIQGSLWQSNMKYLRIRSLISGIWEITNSTLQKKQVQFIIAQLNKGNSIMWKYNFNSRMYSVEARM